MGPRGKQRNRPNAILTKMANIATHTTITVSIEDNATRKLSLPEHTRMSLPEHTRNLSINSEVTRKPSLSDRLSRRISSAKDKLSSVLPNMRRNSEKIKQASMPALTVRSCIRRPSDLNFLTPSTGNSTRSTLAVIRKKVSFTDCVSSTE